MLVSQINPVGFLLCKKFLFPQQIYMLLAKRVKTLYSYSTLARARQSSLLYVKNA